MKTKEFVINIPTEDIMEKILHLAMITEKPSPPRINEIDKVGLTPIESEKVKAPRVKECIAHYECILDWHKSSLIVGKVIAVSVDKSLMERIDNRKMVIVGGGRKSDSYGVVCKTMKWPKIPNTQTFFTSSLVNDKFVF